MVICPVCESQNPDWSLFCGKCRENLSLSPSTYIESGEYEHPLDRAALRGLEALEPLVVAAKWAVNSLSRFMKTQYLCDAVRVSPRQFPEIYRLVEECAVTLSLRKLPEVFIVNHPVWNAFTFGTSEKSVIVIHVPIIKEMSENELKAVIGHEMGHIKSDHVLFHSLALLLVQFSRLVPLDPGIGRLLGTATLLLLYKWWRTSELTADRAALLCAGDVEPVKRAFIKLAVGSSELAERVDVEEFLKQQDEADKGLLDRLIKGAVEVMRAHPFTTQRLRELEEFYASEQYRALREKIGRRGTGRGRIVVFQLNEEYRGGLPFRGGAWAITHRLLAGDFDEATLKLRFRPVNDPWFERHATVEFNGERVVNDEPVKTKKGFRKEVDVTDLVLKNVTNTLKVHIDSAAFKWKLTSYAELY